MERNDAQELSEFWEFQKEISIGYRVQYFMHSPPKFTNTLDWESIREVVVTFTIYDEYFSKLSYEDFQLYKFKIIK